MYLRFGGMRNTKTWNKSSMNSLQTVLKDKAQVFLIIRSPGRDI